MTHDNVNKEIKVVAIDLAKQSFQLHGANEQGKPIVRKKLSRDQLYAYMAQLPACTVAMEACGGAHYWARTFRKYGHQVMLIAPQFVKPFVKSNKNDAADAEAIYEASQRPTMRKVAVKEIAHQDMQSLHRMRSLAVAQRTALVNQVRGILAEYGVVVRAGRCALLQALPDLLVSTALLAATGTGEGFQNGRQFAACLGLVPRQCSTGGKERLLGISKRGDVYLRSLLIHGARACRQTVHKKTDARSQWAHQLRGRRPANVTTVALANKLARTAFAVLKTSSEDGYGAKA
jgi:transposase